MTAAHIAAFDRMWADLATIGSDPRGGYSRLAWTREDHALREWFAGEVARRSMDLDVDRNGNLWAWWGTPGPGSFVTGSHLDSVPGGGAYDGPLGVISAFAAIDRLRADGAAPAHPVAVVCFSDEEGARFGPACVGSRLTTGMLDGVHARALRDSDGVSLAEAMQRAGVDPTHLGRDAEALSRIGVYVELHIEQGRNLADRGRPIAIGSSIWPHGRWRFDFRGAGNHAGTTLLPDRRDPMLTYAETVLSARKRARLAGTLATFGRVEVTPNGTNAIPSAVSAWLDSRGADEARLLQVVEEIESRAHQRGSRDGVAVTVTPESFSATVEFDLGVRRQLLDVLGDDTPVIGTGAGHDAGILGLVVPAGMLYVRNPTGVSHDPAEFAERADCLAGVEALAAVMASYAGA